MSQSPELHTDALVHAASLIRDIPDFPKPGILFRDITPLLADPHGFQSVLDVLAHSFVNSRVDAVVGVESRGFIFGAALAARLNASFVPVRKPGKLPGATHEVTYALEYGESCLQIHEDALVPGARVVVVDDLLATGGTAQAAGRLVALLGAEVLAYAFVIELGFLGGRSLLGGTRTVSLIRYV